MLSLNNIQVTRDNKQILNIADLSIDTQQFTLVLGHNGSGKSTLAKILAGQMAPDSGTVMLNERLLSAYQSRALAKEIGYLAQYLPQVPGLTVQELIKLGRFPWRGLLGRWQREDQQIIEQALEQSDLNSLRDAQVDQLSGGERQRAWIAMLLAQQAQMLILDEPTAALDIAHQYELMQLLQTLHQQQGIGVVVILHDINLALRFAKEVLAMQNGQVAFQGAASDFADAERLSQLFDMPIKVQQHPNLASQLAVVC